MQSKVFMIYYKQRKGIVPFQKKLKKEKIMYYIKHKQEGLMEFLIKSNNKEEIADYWFNNLDGGVDSLNYYITDDDEKHYNAIEKGHEYGERFSNTILEME